MNDYAIQQLRNHLWYSQRRQRIIRFILGLGLFCGICLLVLISSGCAKHVDIPATAQCTTDSDCAEKFPALHVEGLPYTFGGK